MHKGTLSDHSGDTQRVEIRQAIFSAMYRLAINEE
jgi:hypothetical protein